MRRKIEIKLDDLTGVLYALRSGSAAMFSQELREDPELVISFNADGEIVGAILLSASETTTDDWFSNPAREKFPKDLLAALDKWFKVKRTVH